MFSRAEQPRGAHKHDDWECLSRGQAEDTVHRACTRREREACMSIRNGNSSLEDEKKTQVVVLARRENKRRVRARRIGIILERT